MVQAAKPDRILASNTSVLRLTEIAMHARQPAPRRAVATRGLNPPYLIPVLEVARAENTSPVVAEKVTR